MKKKRRKVKDDQPYKVGRPFIKWLDSQVVIMKKGGNAYHWWEKIDNKIRLEAYSFIRTVVKK